MAVNEIFLKRFQGRFQIYFKVDWEGPFIHSKFTRYPECDDWVCYNSAEMIYLARIKTINEIFWDNFRLHKSYAVQV